MTQALVGVVVERPEPELTRLLLRAHQLAARLLHSPAEIREEDVQVLAGAWRGLGTALDALLPHLRRFAQLEELLQRFDRLAGEDRSPGLR